MFHDIRTPSQPPTSLEEVKTEVAKHFQVVDAFTKIRQQVPIYLFRIEKQKQTKEPFKELLTDLEAKDFTVLLRPGDATQSFKIIAFPKEIKEAHPSGGRRKLRRVPQKREGKKGGEIEVEAPEVTDVAEGKEKKGYTWTVVSLLLTLGTIGYAGYLLTSSFQKFSSVGLIPNMILYILSLLSIIGIHETGHMIAAKMHGIEATYPIFIPGLPTIGGTFGAFIKQKSLPANRDELFDLGLFGPIFGFAITLVVTVSGILLSKPVTSLGPNATSLPIPLLYRFLAQIKNIPKEGGLILHPVAFAGWVGFLVTGLNLLPVSQLDGGHISRAMFKGKTHKILSFAIIGLLMLLGYFFMGLLLLFFMRGKHPPPLDNVSKLSTKRKIFGILSWAIVVLSIPPLSLAYF